MTPTDDGVMAEISELRWLERINREQGWGAFGPIMPRHHAPAIYDELCSKGFAVKRRDGYWITEDGRRCQQG